MKPATFLTHFFILFILASVTFLTACTPVKPNTPQTVAEAFWSASLKGDTEAAKRLLTPQSLAHFKIILHDPKDFIELGEQNISLSKAEILTQITRHEGTQKKTIALRTILLNQNGQWLVDFNQTQDSMLGSELQSVIDQLANTMRDTFDKGVKVMGESVKDELQQFEHSLNKTLEDLNQEIERQQQQNQQQAAKPGKTI